MRLDIIIVNYNSTDHLLGCLESLQKALNGLDARFYIQDNASADNVDRITERFPFVNLEKNKTNLGFAKAVNNALKQGDGDFVVLLNPDTYVTEDFFDICLDYIERNPKVGIVGPRILDHDGCLQNSARSFPTPLTAFFGRSSFLSKWFPENPITSKNLLSLKSDGKSPMDVDWVSGACMVIRRDAVRAVGMLDERFFMYWEDADWCHCMREAGWQIVYYPRATVYHYVGGSSEKRVFRSVMEFHKSVYKLFDKHLGASLAFLKPLVFWGLCMRLCFILLTHVLQWPFGGFARKAEPEPNLRPPGMPKQKIKVMRFISRLNIGGPSIHVHLLSNGLDPEKFDSRLVTGKISPSEGDMSYLFRQTDRMPVIIPELQREINPGSDIRAFFHIFKLLAREKPDIVHTHTAKAGTSARLAVFFYNLLGCRRIYMVHTFHGHVFEGYFRRFDSMLFVTIERYLAMITDTIIAISESQKRELADKYRIARENRIRIIELGFDLRPFFNCRNHRGRFRSALGAGPDDFLIGIVGRLVPIKNHHMFLDAAERFRNRNPGMRALFVIIGDGQLRESLESRCRRGELERYVRFCGWVRDVPLVYADLDILALTSLNEGTPVSIVESMAARVPVISTDAGGVRDLLGPEDGPPGRNGFSVRERGILCMKNDARAFASGLKYLAEESLSDRNGRTERARSFVERKYDRRRLFQDIEALYADLLENRRHRLR